MTTGRWSRKTTKAGLLNTRSFAPLSNGGTHRSYYYFNGQRVAKREVDAAGEDVLYLLGDHLGSTSMVLNASGVQEGPTVRYYPYGGVRYPSDPSTFPTDYRFTGQQEMGLGGIYHMGARFYDPYLARWLSADTLVPEPDDPQGLNRYSYVRNSPCQYVDPTGHSCQSPEDVVEYKHCQAIEDDILESTVLLRVEKTITTCRNGACKTTTIIGWSHATILDDHTLLTHNHFEPGLWNEEDFWNGVSMDFTVYRVDGQEITGISYQGSQTYADGPETRALLFGPNSFSSPAAFAEPGDKLPAAGGEVAVVTWQGNPGSTSVQWTSVTAIGAGLKINNDSRNALVVDLEVTEGSSGGGIYWNGTHIANNWFIGEVSGQGMTVGALNPQLC